IRSSKRASGGAPSSDTIPAKPLTKSPNFVAETQRRRSHSGGVLRPARSPPRLRAPPTRALRVFPRPSALRCERKKQCPRGATTTTIREIFPDKWAGPNHSAPRHSPYAPPSEPVRPPAHLARSLSLHWRKKRSSEDSAVCGESREPSDLRRSPARVPP